MSAAQAATLSRESGSAEQRRVLSETFADRIEPFQVVVAALQRHKIPQPLDIERTQAVAAAVHVFQIAASPQVEFFEPVAGAYEGPQIGEAAYFAQRSDAAPGTLDPAHPFGFIARDAPVAVGIGFAQKPRRESRVGKDEVFVPLLLFARIVGEPAGGRAACHTGPYRQQGEALHDQMSTSSSFVSFESELSSCSSSAPLISSS